MSGLPKMTDEPAEPDDVADLLAEFESEPAPTKKGTAVPVVRSAKASAKLAAREALGAEAVALDKKQTEAQAAAARLAQIINLHIAGYSLTAIGAQIGATADEVDRMIQSDSARYVRNQPALRTWVRNFISEKYMGMMEADWPAASDPNSREKLENQDRVLRILAGMERLHGAAAPTQTEVKVEAAPDAVEALVRQMSAQAGLGYNTDIFTTVPGEVVTDAHEQSATALEVSGNQVEQPDEGDEPL